MLTPIINYTLPSLHQKIINLLKLSFFIRSKDPAYLNVVDIAGLVKGAAEGHGLGNAFLSHISACDGIFHLCREYS